LPTTKLVCADSTYVYASMIELADCVNACCGMRGEIESATEEWRKQQIKREKRSGERLKKRRLKGTELKRTKFALPFYHYKDSESKDIIIPLLQSFSDYLESMTAASSSVDEIVK